MNTVDVLREAKALLSDPERWAKEGLLSYTARGDVRMPCEDDAARWCALGAIMRGGDIGEADNSASRVLRGVIGGEIGSWNDDPATTHADLIAAFDRAILAEADKHAHDFNPHTHICPCGATANGQPVDYEALAPLADAVAAVIGE